MGLTKLAIQRPIFILMLMMAAIFMGVRGSQTMRTELNPDVNFGMVTITTVYPGAGPEEVNELISRNIEEAVSSVSQIQEVTSTSQEGVSVVSVQFEIGADMNKALGEVRTKVDSSVGSLPREAEKPIVDQFDSSSDPVMYLALKSDNHTNRELRNLADNEIKEKLSRLPGVASVGVSGGEVREIQVQVRRDDLLKYGIGILDVQQAVQNAGLNVPSGRIIDGDSEYTVRLYGEFRSVEEIGEVYLRITDGQGPQGDSSIVRLSDVATIVDTNAERRSYSRLDGSDSVVIIIQKAKEGSAVEISDAFLKNEFGGPSLKDSIEAEYGMHVEVTTDTSIQIKDSLADLVLALVFGVVLVTLVVWMFLHNLRGTMIVGIAIPVCLMATIVVLWALGFTLNNMSLLALSLAIGVLVDDAIVVIENIYRHLTLGEEPVEAAINGRMEIGLAAIAITLADVVVFIPIAFMGGIVGQFFRPLGIGYAVAVIVSLFVSFTVTPMLASRWYRKGEDWEHPKGRFASWFERSFTKFGAGYANVLAWCLDRRWYVFGLGFAVLVAMFLFIAGSFVIVPDGSSFTSVLGQAAAVGQQPAMFTIVIGILVWIVNLLRKQGKTRHLVFAICVALLFPLGAISGSAYRNLYKNEEVFKFAFAPPMDGGAVNVDIELPPGASLDATRAVTERVEKIVMQHEEVHTVVSRIGSAGGGFGAASQGTNLASIQITLHEKKAMLDSIMFWTEKEGHQRTVASTGVAADMLEMVGRVPGAKVNISTESGFGFGAAIQLSLRSNDRELLAATANKVRDGLASGVIDGVITPDVTSKPGKPELRAIPDRTRLSDYGLTASDVGLAMRTMYEGDNLAKYRELGKEYDIRVLLDPVDRENPAVLASVPIKFDDGHPIRLSDVAEIERTQGVDKIDRRDRVEEIVVTAELLPGFANGSVVARIEAWMLEEELLPEGVEYAKGGEADIQAREMGYLMAAFGMGLLLVYMLLASLYDNLIYPLIIQLAQPQALIGALLALILTDKTLNIVGFIGIIALVGLVGKNAILIVDYANTLRSRGIEKYEALVQAGRTRLRPILMTTISLIAGMMPVALAVGRGSEFRETIGITIIGGVTLSTILTLLIIPCSYYIFDDMSTTVGRWMRRKTEETIG